MAHSRANIMIEARPKRQAIDTGAATTTSCHLIAIQVVPQIRTVVM